MHDRICTTVKNITSAIGRADDCTSLGIIYLIYCGSCGEEYTVSVEGAEPFADLRAGERTTLVSQTCCRSNYLYLFQHSFEQWLKNNGLARKKNTK